MANSKYRIKFVLEGDFKNAKEAEETVRDLIDGTHPTEREMDGGIAAYAVHAKELKNEQKT